ncbi:hypothetical protein ASC72_23080 [Flavobacterium sp. Root420]|nr:hypothetical protein ASC72_23080 [Flavobacterium sp. Root420]
MPQQFKIKKKRISIIENPVSYEAGFFLFHADSADFADFIPYNLVMLSEVEVHAKFHFEVKAHAK